MSRSLARIIAIAVWFLFGAGVFLINQDGPSALAGDYHEMISTTYDFRFGKDKPFSPGNANTFDGKFIEPKDFISSERCASCHTDIHPQWRESAHANAFIEPFYQKNVQDLIDQKNIAFTRHCESCHNPAALFSGALTDKPQFTERPFDKDGVSCIVCHSIESVSGRGIGGYVMGQPALIQQEDGTKIVDASDDDILNDIEGHKRAMMRDLLKKPEFCASCHKSQVPKELNDYKFLRAFLVGDEYQRSSFSKETPHPFYTRDKETCNSCHMQRLPSEYYDVSAKDNTVVSHRFAAANTAIPLAFGYKRQFDEVVGFLQDDKLRIDIFAVSRTAKDSSDSRLIAPLNRKSFQVKKGDTLTADVVITNKNIGHSFPPELRDFYEAFVEFEVKDNKDNTLFKSGFIDPDGFLDKTAHNYKTYLLFGDGSLNDLHHIWRTKVVGHNRQIQSGRSDLSRYQFALPDGYEGLITLSAKVRYRRFTKVFSDYVIGRSENLPIVTMAETREQFNVGSGTWPVARRTNEMPDWWRWNNYGIALLDNQRYPEAADAFDAVADFDNEYKATALANKALALIELGGWKEADKLIKKSLQLEPENYRTLFQSGRILKTFARLDEAEEIYKRVLEKYPYDRMTLQQLGELAKLRSESVPEEESRAQLEIAQGYYERILRIDPEDLSAIYNLMLLSQKLGDRAKAARLSLQFRDLKDDTQVAYLAADFLIREKEIGNESRPYHVHQLLPFLSSSEIARYPSIADIDWTRPLKTTADFPQ